MVAVHLVLRNLLLALAGDGASRYVALALGADHLVQAGDQPGVPGLQPLAKG
jgi:hypothetical protein